MEIILEISFKNARERFIDLQTFVSAEPFGVNIATEMDICYDLIEHGLFIEFSHHEPILEATELDVDTLVQADKMLGDDTPFRGRKSYLVEDNYLKVLDVGDMKDIAFVKFRGEIKIMNVFGEIVILASINMLSALYLAEERDRSLLFVIAELASILKNQLMLTDGSDDEIAEVQAYKQDLELALQIGVSIGLLNKARACAAVTAAAQENESANYEVALTNDLSLMG